MNLDQNSPSGVLLIDKPVGKTAFALVAVLRRILGVQKIGHAGTLDPFATGVMVMLIGKKYTRLSDRFLCDDKEYHARVYLGVATDSYDCDGKVVQTSDYIPSREEIDCAIQKFQGEVEQIPPMFSAKKQGGKKLYELARQGKTVERPPAKVKMQTLITAYTYPHLDIEVNCSKGTYIRSIAHDLGCLLGCGAHLSALRRIRSGMFNLADCIDGVALVAPGADYSALRENILTKLIDAAKDATHS